jgi:deazaflavin-dependent oxidoreductase (nitroreductase family)
MSDALNTNEDVIAYFRSHNGIIPSPYEPDPPPMVLVHTTGRKTGRDHITPMRAMPEGDTLYIFGTAHGSTKDPDWVRNIAANPDIEIEIGTERRKLHATLLDEPERSRIWTMWSDRAPILKQTAAKAARPIPVVKLVQRS